MTIIVGLGNPGEKYTHSRHNTGWRIVEAIAQKAGVSDWKVEKSLEAETLRVGNCVLAKPQTFMNLSGSAVKAVLKKYDYDSLGKKDFHNLFVIYDDLDVEVGKYKLVFGSGPKVHNGVNHIKDSLGTDQFWHVRVGVDGRKGDRSMDPQDYVLGGFSSDEQYLIGKITESVVDLLSQKIDNER
ncbi:MAG: aminoacyl-tRNA hydrolase [Candidatus Woesebacteria bacterium]